MSKLFSYNNPITRDNAMSMRDHQILKVGDRWFMTGTSAPYWKGLNPGVRLFSSSNLLDWKFENWLIDSAKLADDCFYKGRFWAPEIHRAHDRFWLTVNSGHYGPGHGDSYQDGHSVILLVADKITGPYELVSKNGPVCPYFKNDASLFTDENGRSYLYCSGGGLWQSEIDLARGKLVGGDDVQKIIGNRDPGNPDWMIGGIEGPFVINRKGMYYMFFSAWTRGYEIGVLKAPSPLGPWTLMSNSPIMGTRKRRFKQKLAEEGGYAHLVYDDTPDPYVETGHCAIFEGPDGRDWLCCHYFLEGSKVDDGKSILEYYDTMPHLGFEPLQFRNGFFYVNGPTWTKQSVPIADAGGSK